MTVPGVLDDQSLRRYRELLDAEDAAFDELEHACEEGDRVHFDSDFAAWRQALVQKLAFLRKVGIDVGDFAESDPPPPLWRSAGPRDGRSAEQSLNRASLGKQLLGRRGDESCSEVGVGEPVHDLDLP